MAKDQEALVLSLSADIRQFQKQMEKAQRQTELTMATILKETMTAEPIFARSMRKSGQSMVKAFQSGLSGIAGVLAASFAADKVIEYADSYTTLQNGLKVAGLEGAKLAKVEDSLYAAANRNGIAVGSVAQLYQRAAQSRQSLGATDAQLIRLTDGVAAALKVQGVSATAATGPLLQLSQALGSGIVRAEEFNSLAEGTPVILKAAATGITRFGGDIAKLRAEVLNGKITSKEFFDGLLRGLPAVQKQAESMSLTVSGSLQILNNQLGRYVGQTDQGLSATQRMAQGIKALADNLDVIVSSGTVLVTIVGTGMVVAFTRMAIASTTARLSLLQTVAAERGVAASSLVAASAVGSLNKALAFFGGPIGVAILAVASAISILSAVDARQRASMDETADTIAKYKDEQRQAAEAARATAIAAGKHDDATRAELRAVATLTSEVKKLGNAYWDLAAAKKAAEIMTQREQIASVEREGIKNTLALARSKRNDNAPMFSGPSSGMMPAPVVSGTTRKLLDEQKTINDQLFLERRKLADLEKRGLKTFADPTTQAPSDKPKSAATKRREENEAKRRARNIEDLRLESAIATARATGDAAVIKAAEDKQRLAQLTRQYESAGVANAEAAATAHFKDVKYAEDLADLAEREAAASADQAQLAADLIAKGEERVRLARELAQDEIENRLEIARLSGNEKAIKAAERELFIVQRIADLRRLNPNASEQDNKAQATREADARDTARKYGEARTLFANAFAEGIRAAASGDLKTFLANMVGSAAEEGLKRLGGLIYDQIFGNAQAIAQGTLQGSAQGAAASTAIIAAGASSGAAMAAAITAAGSAAGALMAAQITAAAATAGAASGAGNGVSKILSGLMSFDGGGSTGRGARAGGVDGKGGFLGILHPNESVIDHTRSYSPASMRRPAAPAPVYQFDLRGAVVTDELLAEMNALAQGAAVNGATGGAELAVARIDHRERYRLS